MRLHPQKNERPLTFVLTASAPLFSAGSFTDGDSVAKPDHIFDLERRQQVLEREIAQALLHYSPDDPMVADLKSRVLHLKEEIERFCNKAIVDRRLH